jgi:hypothetical protein
MNKELPRRMKGFEEGIQAVLSDKTEQTPEENKAAIERNNKSSALAEKRNAATKDQFTGVY